MDMSVYSNLIGSMFFAAVTIWAASYLFDVVQSRYLAVCDHTCEVAWDCAVKSFRTKG
jgi:hypothetical protein